jgi:SAM-dependent methyltransferase
VFSKSAAFYDALYSWKDYAAEATRLHDEISARVPDATTLLDVACGTGMHLAQLRQWYAVEGVDVEPSLLEVARARLPGVPLHLGDMRTFNLGREFDVVTCLFSSIGYMQTPEDLLHAVANLAGHVAAGGVLIVEPWLGPDRYNPEHVAKPLVAEGDGFYVVRANDAGVAGRLSVMEFHYLVTGPGTVEHFVEEHVIGMFTTDEYRAAFEAAGLVAEHDPEGLMRRGLWICHRPR